MELKNYSISRKYVKYTITLNQKLDAMKKLRQLKKYERDVSEIGTERWDKTMKDNLGDMCSHRL